MGLEFRWDPAKARANRAKHRVSFDEAREVFGDALSITAPDPDHGEAEARFVTIGHTRRGRTLVVVHADRDDMIRVISARRATRRETRTLEEG
ncbi:MAG: BrnT family toxin [bacterium]